MEEAQKELEALLEKYQASLGFQISFPIYREIPVEVQLALQIVKKHGMTISFVLEPKK